MQTITINFQIPLDWHELSDKQLRYVYQLLTQDFNYDEAKTLCLIRWTGSKVTGKRLNYYVLQK